MSTSLPLLVVLTGSLVDLDGSFFLQIGLFFALFFLLRAWVFGPMMRLFDAREAAIDGAKRDAKSIEADADRKLHEFEAEMKKVKIAASAEREALQKDAAALERDLLAKAREESGAVLAEASTKIAADAAKIREEMKASIPVLAGQIAEKLLGRKAA